MGACAVVRMMRRCGMGAWCEVQAGVWSMRGNLGPLGGDPSPQHHVSACGSTRTMRINHQGTSAFFPLFLAFTSATALSIAATRAGVAG